MWRLIYFVKQHYCHLQSELSYAQRFYRFRFTSTDNTISLSVGTTAAEAGGYNELLYIFLGAIVAFIGWIVVHELSAKRDKKNKQRDIRFNYLISAYRTLADSSKRKPSPEYNRKMESALADIQLFGDEQQIEMANKFMNEYEEKSKNAKGVTFEISIDPLLKEFRNNLRKELNLFAINENVRWFRPVDPVDIETR